MKEQIKMSAPVLSLMLLALMGSSCKSVNTQAGLNESSPSAARGYGEFRIGVKDETHLLSLMRVRHGTKHPSPAGVYTFIKEKGDKDIAKHKVGIDAPANRFFTNMYSFEVCEYDKAQSKLVSCWYPFLNYLREPVLLSGDLISLDELSTADGADVILGDLKALWRSDLQDFSADAKAVVSVEHILANIILFANRLWSSPGYAKDDGTYYEIKYLCERKTLRPGKLVQINHYRPVVCQPAPRR